MFNQLNSIKPYRWMVAVTFTGLLTLLLSGNGGFTSQGTTPSTVDQGPGRSLAHEVDSEKNEVDWTLASYDSQDANEPEPDWTLARNNDREQDETDWTLA